MVCKLLSHGGEILIPDRLLVHCNGLFPGVRVPDMGGEHDLPAFHFDRTHHTPLGGKDANTSRLRSVEERREDD